jgi:hypothetical protein
VKEENQGPSGITVGRDRVRQSRTGRFLEVFDVSITPRWSLDGHELTVDPFGDNICDSTRIVRHNKVPSRIPEKLTAALPPFSAPHFSALAFVYQKSVDFADASCAATEQFERGYGFLVDQLNRAT